MSGHAGYRVIFKKQVIGGDHSAGPGDIWLRHEMTLPFPPSDNYGYSDGDWSTESAAWQEKCNNMPPAEIQWDNDEKCFIFYLAPDRTAWYNESIHAMSPGPAKDEAFAALAKEVAQEYVDDYGWELDKKEEV